MRGLRREYDNIKSAYDRSSIHLENEKRKLIDEYERKAKGSTVPSTVERDQKREIESLKKTIEGSEKRFETQKQKIIDEYERKMNQTAGNQEKELRRELENLKKTSKLNEQNFENQKQNITTDYERKFKNLQTENERIRSELERVKTSSTARHTTTHTSPEQFEEIRKLRDTVNKL